MGPVGTGLAEWGRWTPSLLEQLLLRLQRSISILVGKTSGLSHAGNIITVTKTGIYLVESVLSVSAATSNGWVISTIIHKRASTTIETKDIVQGSAITGTYNVGTNAAVFSLLAGDTLTIQASAHASVTLDARSTVSVIEIASQAGPAGPASNWSNRSRRAT